MARYESMFFLEKALCRAFGFDARKVTALTLTLRPGELASLTVTMIPDEINEAQAEAIHDLVLHYRLVPDIPAAEAFAKAQEGATKPLKTSTKPDERPVCPKDALWSGRRTHSVVEVTQLDDGHRLCYYCFECRENFLGDPI